MRFFELAPSPNNVKVRLALRFKGIEFETIAVDPSDRTAVLETSGQANTPVIVDRGVVINDSEAILQFLDANYPDTPRLFPRDPAGRRACEQWRERLGREGGAAWLDIFLASIGRREKHAPESPRVFAELLEKLDGELDGRPSFHDAPEMVVCDLRVAMFAVYALPGEGLIERCRLFRRFGERFGVEPGRFPSLEAMLRPWNDRLS